MKKRIDKQLVATLIAKDIPETVIAQQIDVSHQAVNASVQKLKTNAQIVKEYLQDRANVFRFYQNKVLNFIDQCYDSLLVDLQSGKMNPGQKAQAISVSGTVFGILYDKERIETGKSTSNVAVLHQFMSPAQEKV